MKKINFRIHDINAERTQSLLPYTVQLTNIQDDTQFHRQNRIQAFNQANGIYQTLAYASTLFNNIKIIELGTRYGLSALALSYNPNNHVISYDIIDDGQFTILPKSNLKFIVENIITEEKIIQLLKANLIFVDVDPHDGKQEKFIIDFLATNNYNGAIILDDINYDSMKPLIRKLPYMITKHDISYLKEDATGLYILDFTNQIHIIK